MFSWLTKRLRREPAVLAFGKVPALAEYLQAGSNDDVARELQGWLSKAVEWGATHRAQPWKEALEDSPPLRFVLRSRNPEAVITGVVQSSHDAVGRHFPLALAAVVPVKGAGEVSHLAPLAFDQFLAEALALLPRAAGVASSKELEQLLVSLRPPSLFEISEVQERYASWAQQEPVGALLEALFEPIPASPTATLHTILEATSPFRGQEAPPTALSVRLPTDSERPLLPCFWLQVIRTASRWKETVPGYFDGNNEMLVPLGGLASPSALADCWAPDDRSKYVCHPTGDTSAYATPFPEELAESLASSESTVAEFVQKLGSSL